MSFGVTASSYVAASGLTGDSAYATSLLTNTPLIYLPLSDVSGTTAVDSSGNGRDGTYAGGYVLDQHSMVSGSTGRSVRSDSTSVSVTVPYAGWMDTAELTVLVACMIPVGGISMIAARYATDSGPNSNSWFIDVGVNNHIFFYYRTNSASDVAIDSGVTPTPGKRLYIAAYVNATESGIRIYEDGGALLGASTGAGGIINVSSADLTLFCSQQPNYGLIGYVDDFALFDTSLTTARMDELAALAFAPHQTWIEKTEGTAPRNGTTGHTITFTPASAGSLLVVMISGPVTHTMVTSGWTKQLGPVNSTELAVFTKVASIAEASLQVTHNGSNYPVEYVVYEFPAGSSYHSGVGLQGGGPFPTLSGLPGSNTTVFAGQSEYIGTGGAIPVVNWNYFWRTDVNRGTTGDGVTVGSYLNVGYFAFNDFPDATANINLPGQQYDYLHFEQAVLFAIVHT